MLRVQQGDDPAVYAASFSSCPTYAPTRRPSARAPPSRHRRGPSHPPTAGLTGYVRRFRTATARPSSTPSLLETARRCPRSLRWMRRPKYRHYTAVGGVSGLEVAMGYGASPSATVRELRFVIGWPSSATENDLVPISMLGGGHRTARPVHLGHGEAREARHRPPRLRHAVQLFLHFGRIPSIVSPGASPREVPAGVRQERRFRPSSTATSWMSAAERSMPRRGAGSGGCCGCTGCPRRSDDGNRVYVAFAESCGSLVLARRPRGLFL